MLSNRQQGNAEDSKHQRYGVSSVRYNCGDGPGHQASRGGVQAPRCAWVADLAGDENAMPSRPLLENPEGVLVCAVIPDVDGQHICVDLCQAQRLQQVRQCSSLIPVHLYVEDFSVALPKRHSRLTTAISQMLHLQIGGSMKGPCACHLCTRPSLHLSCTTLSCASPEGEPFSEQPADMRKFASC